MGLQSVVLPFFVLYVMTSGTAGQVLYSLTAPSPRFEAEFGWSVSGAGDVNNDGRSDIIIGEARGGGDTGRAYVFSGADGNLLYSLESPNPQSLGFFGASVSGAGDVNADGYDDIIVGAEDEDDGSVNAGRAYIFSGEDGSLISALSSPYPEDDGGFGFSVSGAGDVDGNGHHDVIVGAPKEDGNSANSGRAYVFKGNGDLLYTLVSSNQNQSDEFGNSVSGIGDVNGDGFGDVAVGAHMEWADTTEAGKAYVFSGDGGGLFFSLQSPNSQYRGYFGNSVSGAGDVNNDGYPDVIVGAYQEDTAEDASGTAYLFEGFSGVLLATLVSPNQEYGGFFGVSVSWLGDVDHDMHDDVIIGSQESGVAEKSGRAYIFSGTGGLLYTLDSPNAEPWTWFGYSVSGAGHVNADGQPDVVVGAPMETAQYDLAGRAYVFTPGGVTSEDMPLAKSTELRIDGPYPNPSNGHTPIRLRIHDENTETVRLTLHDVAGKMVMKPRYVMVRGGNEISVNLAADEEIRPGTYWLRLSAQGEIACGKIVILR